MVLVLKRSCLGLIVSSSSLSMLGSTVSGLLVASILPPWPVVLWPGKCLGVLLVEPLLGPLHSFLLLELLWVPLLCAGKCSFPLTGWILGVALSLTQEAYSLRREGSSTQPEGMSLACWVPQGQLVPSTSEGSMGKVLMVWGCLLPPLPSFLRALSAGLLSPV